MKKICMVVLDGFGYSDNKLGNAVMMAPPTNFLNLWKIIIIILSRIEK